jgi:SynChlorMet cassette radical SAM/SPASM protein ScmE
VIELMPTPRTLDLEITSRCNARCRYCYYKDNEGVEYLDLPTSRWLEFFDELGRAKVMSVCFAGGEPLLREDIFDLIDGIVKNRMRFQILTNGARVTRQLAKRLRKTGRCSSIQVSLDGSRAEVHEIMRGKGSFEPALRAIKVLMEEALPVTVRVTVHGPNIDDLPAIAHLLLDELGLRSFSTNSISALGSRAKYGDDLFLAPAQRLRAMRVLALLDSQHPGRVQATAGPLADWKMYGEMESARRNGSAIRGRGRLVGCGCIFSKMAVRADGAYVPCIMLPQMVLGHVGKDSLEEVWRNAKQFNNLRQRTSIPLRSFDECRECEYLDTCTGNCPGTALSLSQDPNRPSAEACLNRFKNALAAEGLSIWKN